VILAELMFGTIVAAVVLLLLPFLRIIAGVGVVVLLWLMHGRCWAPCSFGLVFPGSYAFAILMILLVGLLFLSIDTFVAKLADGRKPGGVRRAPAPEA
jgi:hypothetical protein